MNSQTLIELGKERNIKIEILHSNTKETDIRTLNEKEILFDTIDVNNYTIKAIKNGKCVKLKTGTIEDGKALLNYLEEILENQENDNENRLSEGNIIHLLDSRESVDFQEVKRDLLSLNELRKTYKEIINIENVYSYQYKRINITNENSLKEDEFSFHSFDTTISIGNKELPKSIYISFCAKEYDFSSLKKQIIKKIELALLKLNSSSCKTDKYRILLDRNAVVSILSQFKDMFQTKNIEQKDSVLVDSFGKKVFSSKINIVEDPKNEKAITPRFFDGEGSETKRKDLIKDGVFVKKINNLEYALKMQEEATGNSYGVNNMYIVPNLKKIDLLKELDHGIYIDSVVGTHSGIDLITGNISLQSEGFLVENGKISKGLNMIILSTNIFELFSNILELGNELSYDIDVLAPDLLLENITITGKE